MKLLKGLIIGIVILLLQSCLSFTYIQRSENFVNSKPHHVKLICIEPQYYFYDEEDNFKIEKNQKLSKRLKKDILKFSKSNKIELEIVDLNELSKPSYYNDLLRLRRHMLVANTNIAFGADLENTELVLKQIQKNVFVYPPKIPFEFSKLSDEYGTPYFSFVGICLNKFDIVLYHVVVNTDLCEVVYRESKRVMLGKNNAIVKQMIYDTYAMFYQEIKGFESAGNLTK